MKRINMATFVITSTDNTFEVSKDGLSQTFPKGIFINQTNVLDSNQLACFNKYKNIVEYQIYTDTDFINVNGSTSWSDAEELKTALKNVMFLTSSPSGSVAWGGITGLITDQTDLYNEIFNNRIIVKTAADFGVIDSTKEYYLDGIIDMTGVTLEVPSGGINIKGYDFNISGLYSTNDNHTLFTSPVGGSGDFLLFDFYIDVQGASSKVYDIVSDTGFNAIEASRINYNNCTSLGEIDGYRQGLEIGTGRFGGSPSLTLSGTWLGGYRVTTSIVRSMSDTTTEPLFKEGTSFVMNSRFLTDINCDLGDLQPLLNFQASNFPNSGTLQLKGCEITRGGVYAANDSNITPNINKKELSCYWKGNNGLPNTFVGGTTQITSEELTVISVGSTYYTLDGVFTGNGLEHFSASADGKLTHLGINPREFEIIASLTLESAQDNELSVRFVKWDDSLSSFTNLDYTEQTRPVNNLVGGRDVAVFTIINGVVMDQNDYIFLEVKNNSGNNNITAESSSFFRIKER